MGLGAVTVERTGTRLGEDVPGDEAAGARGIPFAAPDGLKDFDWEGPNLPNCPGGPFPSPVAQFCPSSITVNCLDCPGPLQGNTTSTVNISSVPEKCLISDVDVAVDMFSQFYGDLTVSLAGPGQAQLMNAWCGATQGDMNVIFDSDATLALGCPPQDDGSRVLPQAGAGNLDAFDGKVANGDWTFTITDPFAGDPNRLDFWSVTIATQ